MTQIFSGVEQELLKLTVPTYAILIITEMTLSNWQGKKMYSWRDVFTNLYLTLANMLCDVATRGLTIFLMVLTFRYHIIDASALKSTAPWLYWTLCVMAWEFMFYWLHRMEHSVRFFWAVHATHHSSEYFNLSVGFRSSVLEPLYRFVFYLPLALVGFQPLDAFLVFSATQIYGLLVHTQYINRIPVWEWLFVTPAHHRVHHACNIRYLDRNMGMFLIIWDRIFGTFADEIPEDKPRFGLVTKQNLTVPFNVIFHEWQKIASDFFVKHKSLPLSIRLKYVFGAPGWSHDGSTKTSEQLRKEG